jgi:hypothetical protein
MMMEVLAFQVRIDDGGLEDDLHINFLLEDNRFQLLSRRTEKKKPEKLT